MSDGGYVYFAQAASRGISPIKIGWSKNPWSQVHEAHRWLWFQIEVVGFVRVPEGPFWGTTYDALEQTLHRHFANTRLCTTRASSEWFQAEPVLVGLARVAANGCSIRQVFEYLAPLLDEEYVRRQIARAG